MIKYFSEKLDINLKRIYLHRTITAVGVQLVNIFSVIFIYDLLNNNYRSLVLFYLILAILSVIFLPSLGYFINRYSYKWSIILGSLFRLLLWISFFITSFYNFKWGLFLIALGLVGIRVFYWAPYKTDFMTFRKGSDHTKSVSVLISIQNIMGIFTPLIAGIILTYWSYNVLFAIGILFLFLAILPLKKLKKINNRFIWNYKDVLASFLSPKNRKFVLASIFNGMESMITFIWPIFIYEILQGNFFKIGVVVTVTTLVVVILNLFLGKYIDFKGGEKKFLKYGTTLTSLAWFIKIFVTTGTQIFFVDVYHRIANSIYQTPFQSLIYGFEINKKKLLDEYALLTEFSFRAGQIISAIFLVILSYVVSLNWFFIIAAFSVLLLNFIPNKNKNE